jgi:four helix bundle protein
MTQKELKARTKKNCINTILFLRTLPKNEETTVISKQLIRSSTSVAANYRAACRAKSTADFINKIKIVEEEADESCFWLEILEELYGKSVKVENLLKEYMEVTAIFTATGQTLRIRNHK